MENEINISLGGTIILLALFAQKILLGKNTFESILHQEITDPKDRMGQIQYN